MALDFATKLLLEQFAQAGGKPLHEGTVAEARELSKAFASMAGPAPKMSSIVDHAVPVEGGTITARVIKPEQRARGVIVWYHGGGWVIGSIDDNQTLASKLAERTSCAVVLVGYRLAPEHRYPTAPNDAYAGLLWAAAHRGDIVGDADAALMVGGDSAGANLAAVVAQRARDTAGPALALQVLVYPVTDADFGRASYVDPENQLILTKDAMTWFWDLYVPDEAARGEPGASPLRAASLAGLAPAVVLTAEHDVLRDEGEAYAKGLELAGVPVDFKRHAGQTHGFFTLLALPGSEHGFQQVVKAVRASIHQHSRKRAA